MLYNYFTYIEISGKIIICYIYQDICLPGTLLNQLVLTWYSTTTTVFLFYIYINQRKLIFLPVILKKQKP